MNLSFRTSVFLCFAIIPVAGQADRPNIILCMGDDHGWDETGYNGHPHLQTPVLDEMAASGLQLNRFYSAHPTCSPTRVSVLTGRHPNRSGTFQPNYSTRPEEITIAHLLSEAGYLCGHFGKWHVGPVKKDSPTSPGALGFSEWLSHDNFFELNPVLSRNGGPPEKLNGESSEVIIAEAIQFMARAQKADQPFLTVVWFGSPHEPYSGLPEDLALYDDLPDEYATRQFRLTSNETGRPTTRNLREILRERYAEITAMDRAMGHLRDWLRKQDLRDNTLLWYCGDNGTPGDGIITSPLRGHKGALFGGGVRVPGIIEWPAGVPQPFESQIATVTSDMLPTVCRLADLDLPDRPIDGIDLSPMFDKQWKKRPSPIGFWSYSTAGEAKNEPYLKAEQQTGTTPLVKLMNNIPTRNFTNFHHPRITDMDYAGGRVWLDQPFKLHVSGSRGEQEKVLLFDVLNDPGEKTDLAESHPDVVKRMRSELRDWQKSVLTSLTGADYHREQTGR